MIDLHSHILPGVDDGARTLDESVEIARAAVDGGIEVLAATPHVRDDYPTAVQTMENLVGELRRLLAQRRIPLDVRTGGEIAIDRIDGLSRDELRRFGLAGNPGYLLVEFSYYGWPLRLPDLVFRLRSSGITPVLAHPERNADVQAAPERLRQLVDAGALVQITAASIDGRLGGAPEKAGLELVRLELAHLLASDAHHASLRAAGMRAAVEAIGDVRLGRWLAHDVPEAIVSDRPLPERPRRPEKRRRWPGRRGLPRRR